MRKRPLTMVCLLGIAFLFLSTKLIKSAPPFFEEWEGQRITVVGEVYQKESYHKAGKEIAVVYLKLFSMTGNEGEATIQSEDYRVICYLKSGQEIPKMGSIVKAVGEMRCFEEATNPGQFDAESYYHFLKISFQLNQTEIQQQSQTYQKGKEALYHLRCRLSKTLEQTLPERDAALMKTIMLGERKAVDVQRKELYQKSGIAHILAISGLHISLIGMVIFKMLRRLDLPIGICTAIPVVLILLYGTMTGFTVSVIRAVGMFAIHMLGCFCKRTYDMVTAIAVTALLQLIWQPMHFYNSSFLLSYGCVIAIAVLIPALTKRRLKGERELKPWIIRVIGGIIITWSMLPFQMWFFYQIPVYAVVLNLLVIPFMSLLLPSGMALLLSEEMITAVNYETDIIRFTKPVSYLISGILAIYDRACELCNQLPIASFCTGRPAVWKVICFFIILLLIVLWQKKVSRKKKWLVFALAVILLLCPVKQRENCRLTFLDVGQGDCIHIESCSGKHYLIDGGSSTVNSVGEYRILPYLKYNGVRELEAVFITHPDEDHCNGIKELIGLSTEEQIKLRRLCLPDIEDRAKTEAYKKLVEEAQEEQIPIVYFSKGMLLQDGDLQLQCLHPSVGCHTENENAYSLVFLMKYGEFEALLTGDVEEEGELELIQTLQEFKAGVEIEVLKVAHHGSRYSTSEAFLSLVRPKLAVISCGENNTYGHPHRETIERLADRECNVYSTADCGAITITIGQKIKVQMYRAVALVL